MGRYDEPKHDDGGIYADPSTLRAASIHSRHAANAKVMRDRQRVRGALYSNNEEGGDESRTAGPNGDKYTKVPLFPVSIFPANRLSPFPLFLPLFIN